MKKILICLLTFVLLSSFGGCVAKEKLDEKVAEKIFEKAGGDDLDIWRQHVAYIRAGKKHFRILGGGDYET